MKQTTRLAFAGLAVGLIFAGIGAALGGVKSVVFDHGFQIAETKTRTVSLQKVNQLNITNRASMVTVKVGQKAQVKLIDRQVNKIHVTQQNGLVAIDNSQAQQNWDGINLENTTPQIIVTVPQKELQQVQITSHSGSVNLHQFRTKLLNVQGESAPTNLDQVTSAKGSITNTGSVLDVKQSQLSHTQLTTGSGSLNVHNSVLTQSQVITQSGAQRLNQTTFTKSACTSQSGAITLQQPKINQGLTLKATSGAVRVQQPVTTPTGYHILTGSGQIRLQQQTYQHEFTRNPNSANVLKVQTNSGAVNVN